MRSSWNRTRIKKLGRRLQMGRIMPTIITTEAAIFATPLPSLPLNSPTLRIREGNHDVGKSRRASRTKNRKEGAGAASSARSPRPPETRSPLRLPGFRLPTRLLLPPRRPLCRRDPKRHPIGAREPSQSAPSLFRFLPPAVEVGAELRLS